MTKQEQIEILMADGCTKSDAEKHFKNDTTIYCDLEENLDTYLSDWEYLNDDLDDVKYTDAIAKMVQTKEPLAGWGIVEKDGKTYDIEYAS